MPADEYAARREYARSVASLLLYDHPHVPRDAPAAFVAELERRFLADGQRGAEARRGAGGELLCDLANRTAGAPRCHHARRRRRQ